MKKFTSTILLLATCLVGFSQKVVTFTLQSDYTDTVYVPETQIEQVTKTTAGSNLSYFNTKGDLVGLQVRERAVDTANVASSVVITFAGSAGSVDSITINGVEIMGGSVAFTSTLSTTLGLVEDSIDNTVQSPVNYSATNTATTVTISAPAAFGDTANGYEVIVYTTTLTATPSPTVMASGFTSVRNILTMSDRLFNVESGAKTWNADRVLSVSETSAGGTISSYEGSKLGQKSTTDSPATVTAAINAL